MTDKTFQTLKNNLKFAITHKNLFCYQDVMKTIGEATEALTESQSNEILELMEEFRKLGLKKQASASSLNETINETSSIDCENCSS